MNVFFFSVLFLPHGLFFCMVREERVSKRSPAFGSFQSVLPLYMVHSFCCFYSRKVPFHRIFTFVKKAFKVFGVQSLQSNDVVFSSQAS